MPTRIIEPPFDELLLNEKIPVDILDISWLNVSDDIRWILCRPNPGQIKSDITRVWRQSSLPIADWADQIRQVDVVLGYEVFEERESYNNLMLSVKLGDQHEPLHIGAPLTEDELTSLTKDWPYSVPKLIREIAIACPGLSMEHGSSLVGRTEFLKRFHYIQKWCGGLISDTPDLSMYIMQIADTSFGNTFLLHKDGSIGQFAHDEVCIDKLAVDLPGLIDSFFQDPENLEDILEQGWVELEDMVSDVEAYKQDEKVTKTFSELSFWGAYAVVAKLHIRVSDKIASLLTEPSRSIFLELHRRVLKLVTASLCSGKFCPEDDTGIDKDDIYDCVEKGMGGGSVANSLHASVCLLMNAAVRDDYMETYASSCSRSVLNLLNGDFPAFDEDELAEIWRHVDCDVAQVISLELDMPGSLERPVPREFFD